MTSSRLVTMWRGCKFSLQATRKKLLKKFRRRGQRGRNFMWPCLVLVMMFFVLITQMCDETNCNRSDYHIITMRSKFSFQCYLDNVEHILMTLFQRSDNPAGLGDKGMIHVDTGDPQKGQVQHRKLLNFTGVERTILHERDTSGVLEYNQKDTRDERPHREAQGEVRPLLEPPPEINQLDLQNNARVNQSLRSAGYETKIEMKSRKVKSLSGPEKMMKEPQMPGAGGNEKHGGAHSRGKEDPERTLADFRRRAQRVASICDAIAKNRTDGGGLLSKAWETIALSISKAETVTGVLWHRPSQTSYCFVPKAGCTFWMRIFYFLQHNNDPTINSPWDIPRLAVHASPRNPYARGAPLWYLENEILAPNTVRFMVTRDPFTRLWSAYVDKLFLPDFWISVGVDVVRRFRGDPDDKAKVCGHDVSFDEFIQHVLTKPNSHWDPIHSRCDPCRYQPQVIAQMDTFARDSTVILRRMGVEHVLTSMDRAAQNELELRTLIDYNLDVTRDKPELSRCVSQDDTAQLLWKAFQVNGYLPLNVPYSSPVEEAEEGKERGGGSEGGATPRPFPKEKFADEVIRVFRNSGMSKAKMSAQRKPFMRKAYESLAPELLEGLQTKYRMDFLLFGYDMSPFAN